MTEGDIYSDQPNTDTTPEVTNTPIVDAQPQEPQVQGFYGTGIDEGRIVDPNVAEDIAYVAKDQGMDAATARENALRNEYETGLTEEQRVNREIKEGLLKVYPYAYEKVVLPDGNTVLVEKNFPTGEYASLIIRGRYTEEQIKRMDLTGKNIITDDGLLRLPLSMEKGHRYTPQEIQENLLNTKKFPRLSNSHRGFFPNFLLTMNTTQMDGFRLRNELLNEEYERVEKQKGIEQAKRITNAADFLSQLTNNSSSEI